MNIQKMIIALLMIQGTYASGMQNSVLDSGSGFSVSVLGRKRVVKRKPVENTVQEKERIEYNNYVANLRQKNVDLCKENATKRRKCAALEEQNARMKKDMNFLEAQATDDSEAIRLQQKQLKQKDALIRRLLKGSALLREDNEQINVDNANAVYELNTVREEHAKTTDEHAKTTDELHKVHKLLDFNERALVAKRDDYDILKNAYDVATRALDGIVWGPPPA